jgi:GT2 family glycosyltransferase
MRQDTHERRRPSSWRKLIQRLNQRYRAEFDRAERLAAELADIKASRAWRILAWLRRITARRRRLAAGRGPARCPRLAAGRSPTGLRPAAKLDVGVGVGVSIIIPFRDQPLLLRRCLRSLRKSTYRHFEIILVDNGSEEPATWRLLRRYDGRNRCRIAAAPGPFNFSLLCNRGAALARGEFLLFLNNDVEVLAADWLERLLEAARQPGVGVTGAMLLYPDGTIQHGGMAETLDGWIHLDRGDRPDAVQQRESIHSAQAVTGACLLIRRELFTELGGFDERMPVTHNDVDLCLRVRERGLDVVVAPSARLLHYESLSRGYGKEASTC